ncbi:nacht lrr and pyd domains-containing protein [Anaeramoeba flamelloides]|uniref:Nacht lrr and pyd domains-containing protein n=1 Tax=Anaeramoeba flamelloides TaxID=1746091 RepID=A0AAV8AI16_9EUKA|nr:nacht lrr and pyd domains-containing protein [Anaeramoeba flamelloides]
MTSETLPTFKDLLAILPEKTLNEIPISIIQFLWELSINNSLMNRVDFRDFKIGRNIYPLVGSMLSTNKTVRILNFNSNILSTRSLGFICNGIIQNKEHTNVKHLSLRGIGLNLEKCQHLSNLLSNNTSIKKLVLDETQFDNVKCLSVLSEGLKKNKTLSLLVLNIKHLKSPSEDIETFFSALNCQTCNFIYSTLHMKQFEGMCKGLMKNKSLTTLVFDPIEIENKKKIQLLTDVFKKKIVQLRHLSFSTPYSTVLIKSALGTFYTSMSEISNDKLLLTTLNLTSVGLRDSSTVALSKFLSKAPFLKTLSLADHHLTGKGFQNLIKTTPCLTLKNLDVGSPKYEPTYLDESKHFLNWILTCYPMVENLSFDSIFFISDATFPLFDSVYKCKELKTISFKAARFDSDSSGYLSELLRTKKINYLESINFSLSDWLSLESLSITLKTLAEFPNGGIRNLNLNGVGRNSSTFTMRTGFVAVVTTMLQMAKQLNTLSIASCPLSISNLWYNFILALKSLDSLKNLDIRYCLLKPPMLEDVSLLVREHKNLQSISVIEEIVTEEIVSFFASALGENKKFKYIELGANSGNYQKKRYQIIENLLENYPHIDIEWPLDRSKTPHDISIKRDYQFKKNLRSRSLPWIDFVNLAKRKMDKTSQITYSEECQNWCLQNTFGRNLTQINKQIQNLFLYNNNNTNNTHNNNNNNSDNNNDSSNNNNKIDTKKKKKTEKEKDQIITDIWMWAFSGLDFSQSTVKDMAISLSISNPFGFSWETRLLELYKDQESKDFSIITKKNQQIKVHKNLLQVKLGVFRDMFLTVENSCKSVTDYSDHSLESWELFIEFIYLSKFEFHENHDLNILIDELLELAQFYQLENLNIFEQLLQSEFEEWEYQQYIKKFNTEKL